MALFNERNTPMFEIWTYAVSPADDKVYYAVWGGGVLEYDVKTERWKDYNDPDGETEMVLMKDQGLIHEITTSVSYVDKILWVATYFGASRYDGRYWHNFLRRTAACPATFSTRSKQSTPIAPGSDRKGLAYYDGTNWAVYRPALDTHKPEMLVRDADGKRQNIPVRQRAGAQLHPRRRFPGRRHLGRHRTRVEPRNSTEDKDQAFKEAQGGTRSSI